jgi:hypothetical protein
MADNGPEQGDEINVVHPGDYLGWPFSWGNGPALGGSIAPRYVFPETTAPTGVLRLSDRNPVLRGYLFCSFWKSAIYLVPDIDATPFPAPLAIMENDRRFVIDAAQAPNGDVYFVTYDSIERLVHPSRGDCNGDGLVNAADVSALYAELRDGAAHPAVSAAEGAHRGSFGCDADGSGTIDGRDVTALLQVVHLRRRSAAR